MGEHKTKYKLPEDLYTYQKEDAATMAKGDIRLNFSQMGVGKTPTTIAMVEDNKYDLVLVVCTNTLMLEWARQIEEWVGKGHCVVAKGNSYTRMGPIIRSLKNREKRYKIINYEMFRSEAHYEMLSMIPFQCVIFDEIHKLRNPKTKNVKAIWKYLNDKKKAKVIGLTGSPIMNYPNDLYALLAVVYPDKYSRDQKSWKNFMYKYCLFSIGKHGSYVYGTQHLDKLRKEIDPLIIERKKKDVLPFLPDKYYQRVELEMSDDQRKLYNQMETELMVLLDDGQTLWSPGVLSKLTRLRQMNLDPKIVGVTSSAVKTEYIWETVSSTDEKVVIFSCFEKYIDLLHNIFDAMKIKNVVITGTRTSEQRTSAVKQFQEDPDTRVCLGTIQCMGEGVTLTASSTVIMADRWWNEPTNQQAVDRLHRIGQKNAVQVIYPVCKESIDEVLDNVLQRKHEASQQFYSEQDVKEEVFNFIHKK